MDNLTEWELYEQYKEKKAKGEKAPSIQILSKDWNDNVLPVVKEKHLNPLLQLMDEARYAYLKSVKDYYVVLEHYKSQFHDIYRYEASNTNNHGPLPVNELMNPRNSRNLPLINPDHLFPLEYRKNIPEDLKIERYKK
ncbi:hypothetical protein [Aquibacillus rhizosphaerae]|uniref:Uncharacterized protein n=1 Tax=Aquibacillus rhizosphaerae TaxID=3051431 RepID=A0ABT7LBI9_9BACI|nr:hypothetical protein [Aquibacillus sp. LR5S19]MDL4843242.1 hypothetical protein [Aquibacillus sp. LR5S19]